MDKLKLELESGDKVKVIGLCKDPDKYHVPSMMKQTGVFIVRNSLRKMKFHCFEVLLRDAYGYFSEDEIRPLVQFKIGNVVKVVGVCKYHDTVEIGSRGIISWVDGRKSGGHVFLVDVENESKRLFYSSDEIQLMNSYKVSSLDMTKRKLDLN